MTTQEIHSRLNHRAGKHIPIKHMQLLMTRFEEIHGEPVSDTNIEICLVKETIVRQLRNCLKIGAKICFSLLFVGIFASDFKKLLANC